MAENRITQTPLEVLTATSVSVRETQTPLEALVTVTPKVRSTQNSIETLVTVSVNARISQVVIEVLVKRDIYIITQTALEVLIENPVADDDDTKYIRRYLNDVRD
jgi:hypothetical protein